MGAKNLHDILEIRHFRSASRACDNHVGAALAAVLAQSGTVSTCANDVVLGISTPWDAAQSAMTPAGRSVTL